MRQEAGCPRPAPDGVAFALIPRLERALSPKRPVDEKAGLGDIFPYYAGFSYDWARDRLAALGLPGSAVVLDPWNGSGATVLAAQSIGLASVGIDLNPVACVVAQLKVQGRGVLVPSAPSPDRAIEATESEPLLAWFSPRVAGRLRSWVENAGQTSSRLSKLVLIVSLFRLVRNLTKRFEGSNPTWVRISRDDSELVDLDLASVDELVHTQQREIASRLAEYPPLKACCSVVTSDARRLPLATSSVDAILTSPPYLTRIDYAIAYSRELAVLGFPVGRNRNPLSRSLRAQLMGTTLIRGVAPRPLAFAPSANELIRKVSDHASKDSAGYYVKQLLQYLTDLTKCLDELSRVAKRDAPLILVVQDSYYKEVPIPLAEICIEEAEGRGWILADAPKRYKVTRHLTQLNTAARAYPKGGVAESVLTLRRA